MISQKVFEERKKKFLSDYVGELIAEAATYEQDVHFVFDGERFRTFGTTERNSWSNGLFYVSTVEGFGIPDDEYMRMDMEQFDEAFVAFLRTGDYGEVDHLYGEDFDENVFAGLDIPGLKSLMDGYLDGKDRGPRDTGGVIAELLGNPGFENMRKDYELCAFKEALWNDAYEDLYEHVRGEIEDFAYEDCREWEEESR